MQNGQIVLTLKEKLKEYSMKRFIPGTGENQRRLDVAKSNLQEQNKSLKNLGVIEIKSKNQLDDITAKKAFDQSFKNLQKNFKEGVFVFAANDGLAKSNIDQPQLLIAAMVAQDTAGVEQYDHKAKQLYHFFKSIANLMEINRAEWIGKRTEKERQVAHENYLKSAHGKTDNAFDYKTFCQKLGSYPGTMVDYFE